MINEEKKLWRSLLVGASLIAVSSVSSTAVAQDAEEDEVIATGIRQSLKASMDFKRDAQGVVDAITAEDIGKFPDTNLAESLQRITGVSIDRANGEGNTVTVRGWGPDFNLVTLNGRQMPTATLGDGASPPSSRSFDFGALASEAISSVEVYKTSRPATATGGIGSQINIRTTRPLDSAGFNGTIGIKGVADRSTGDTPSLTPEISGLFSDTFANDTIGIAISGSYQKREGSVNNAGVGWREGLLGSDETSWGRLPPATGPNSWNYIPGAISNQPSGNDVYAVAQNAAYDITDFERERINGQATLQFRPTDDITITGDYTYSKNQVEARTSSVGIWYNHVFTSSAWTDGPVVDPLFYSEDFGGAPSDLSYSGSLAANEIENKSIGVNLEWDVSDRLSVWADFHDSSAEARPGNEFGSNMSVGTAVFGLQTQSINFEQDLPVISFTNAPGVNSEDISARFATGNAFRNAFQRSEIQQIQIGGSYDLDMGFIESVDFGFSNVNNKVRSAFGFIQTDSWGGRGTAADIPDDIFFPISLRDKFSDIQGSDNPAMIQSFYGFDFERMVNLLEDQFNICSQPWTGSSIDGTCLADFTTDRRIEEDVLSGYFQLNAGLDVGGRRLNVVGGLRYEETDVDSAALVPIPSTTSWVAVNEFNIGGITGSDFTSVQGGYDHWLPAVDVDYEVTEDIKLRASYSKTITRPLYNDLQGGLTLDNLFRINGGTGNRGNPGLVPNESTNYDASAEWYYDDDSYISAGYFRKKVSNFTGRDQITENAFGLTHPGQGPRAREAEANVGIDLAEIRQYIFDNADPSTFTVTGVDQNGFTTGQIFGVPGDDLVDFLITIPVASDQTATVDGVELALQHTFGDSGFGVIANYTYVDSDLAFDNTLPNAAGTQFVLPGVSDTANLVGFYDKNGLQARIAWNWRDDFFSGGGQDPFYVEAYQQIDANVSYDFTDNLTLFAESINLTGENRRGHRRSSNTVTFVQPGKPRYAIGARYKF